MQFIVANEDRSFFFFEKSIEYKLYYEKIVEKDLCF